MEFVLIYKALSLINQNVCTLSLDSALLYKELLHCRIMLISCHVLLPVFIFSSKSLCWYIFWVKMIDQSIIELIPIILPIWFSIFDESVIMTGIRCAIMNHNTLQIVLVVLLWYLSVKGCQLIFVKIFCGQIFWFHHLLQISFRYFVLAVWSHVQFHREWAVVIDLNFRHSVEVELKTFEL